MKMSVQEVADVAVISHIEIGGEQLGEYHQKINNILEYVQILNEADTNNIEPAINIFPLKNVTRKDETLPSLARETALKLCAEQEDGYIKVAKIMES